MCKSWTRKSKWQNRLFNENDNEIKAKSAETEEMRSQATEKLQYVQKVAGELNPILEREREEVKAAVAALEENLKWHGELAET